jgi:hypothetical protein
MHHSGPILSMFQQYTGKLYGANWSGQAFCDNPVKPLSSIQP